VSPCAAAITVGATGCPASAAAAADRCAADEVSDFSNHGAAVDVYAPGDKVRSAWRASDDAWRVSSGTSMAAPLVAGAVALYLERHPAATPEDIARAIASTATALRDRRGTGDKMLNLAVGAGP